jgi:hypothetical protein
MNTLSWHELRELLAQRQGPCLSLYLPASRAGAATEQTPIRFRNLLRKAEEQLLGAGLRSPEARKLLAPAQDLLGEATFWQHQDQGLAVFLAPGFAHIARLPLAFAERVTLAPRFQITPLLPLLARAGHFYVLALSQQAVNLLRGTYAGLHALPLPDGAPANLAQALRYDDAEPQRGYFTGTPGVKGRQGAIFYGVEVKSDEHKADLLRFCQQLDRALQPLLHDEQAPLVLAGVEYLLALYRMANTYPHLLDEQMAGNPEHLSVGALHERAWALVQPYFLRAQQAALARYRERVGTGWATDDTQEILRAARAGRVADLFIAGAAEQWGVVASDTATVTVHPTAEAGDENLVELAATATLAASGDIYVLDPDAMPRNRPLAALFRY